MNCVITGRPSSSPCSPINSGRFRAREIALAGRVVPVVIVTRSVDRRAAPGRVAAAAPTNGAVTDKQQHAHGKFLAPLPPWM